MIRALVGYTGFVGSNLDRAAAFEGRYNTGNIREAFGTQPDFLIYAGVRAEKYLANRDPEGDLAHIKGAFENIERIRPRKLVLISTADVYKVPCGVDEDTPVDIDGLHPYGLNRYRLERWVRAAYPDAVIVRLPGLYGPGLKKNFIYDYIHRIPFMLTGEKFRELASADDFIKDFYRELENGFYECRCGGERERPALRAYFDRAGFSALAFTDSRSCFQFYPVQRLWRDLQVILEAGAGLVNITAEPVSAGELYRRLAGQPFENRLDRPAARYDIRSRYAGLFGSGTPYMLDKRTILGDIEEFVRSSV